MSILCVHIVCPYCVGHNVLVKLFRHILSWSNCVGHIFRSNYVGRILWVLGQMCFVFMFQICYPVHLACVTFVKYDNFLKVQGYKTVTSTVMLMAVPLAKKYLLKFFREYFRAFLVPFSQDSSHCWKLFRQKIGFSYWCHKFAVV